MNPVDINGKEIKVGDIIRAEVDSIDIQKGFLYKVTEVFDDAVYVFDDISDDNCLFSEYVTLVQSADNVTDESSSIFVDDNGKVIKDNLEDTTSKVVSDGGPSKYYDFLNGWQTWNDLADYKSVKQWKEHSFHLGNIGKAIFRWGEKDGTSKTYDAKKIVYSGLRVLLMLEGKDKVEKYLTDLLKDRQFKP